MYNIVIVKVGHSTENAADDPFRLVFSVWVAFVQVTSGTKLFFRREKEGCMRVIDHEP